MTWYLAQGNPPALLEYSSGLTVPGTLGRLGISRNAFRIFHARTVPYGTSERPVVLQSQRDCVLQPRVAESARLPWVGVRAIFNPNGVVAQLPHRAATPWGLADTTRFSQGSSRLATLGLGAESLWDSTLEFAQSIGVRRSLFPLTSALSRRERGNCSPSAGASSATSVQRTRSRALPLPEGEGRGEGERGPETRGACV